MSVDAPEILLQGEKLIRHWIDLQVRQAVDTAIAGALRTFAHGSGLLVAADARPFQIATIQEDDRVAVLVEKDRIVLDIHSPFEDQPGQHRAVGEEVAGASRAATSPQGAGKLQDDQLQGEA